ncbi:S8 family serine peptidase [Microcoleus sp. herbarium12]|uniref:S8 family serine peptidase n=1 Tax=Microcoleus sp. herbarium12 TaxID=3055437 RepID=UPI002FD38FBD
MSNISIGNLNDNYISIDFAGKTDPTDTYRFNRLNPGSFRVTAEGFTSVVGMQLLDTQGKVVKDIETNGTNSGTFSIDNLGATNYALKISAPSRDTNYQVSLTPDGKVDPLTGLGVTSGFFTPDSTGQVGFDWLHDGGNYQGEVAIFSVQGMENFDPASEEFIEEAARRALSNSLFGHVVISDSIEGANPLFNGRLGEDNYNEGKYSGPKTFAMKPGEPFAVMLVPNGTVRDVFNNPGADGDKRPLLSLSSTNPDDAFLYGQIADVTGNGKAFAMEDQRVDEGSDKDYNDLVFNLTGATGKAVAIDKVIDPKKDWTKLDGGKKLLEYVTPKPPVATTPPVVVPPTTPPVVVPPTTPTVATTPPVVVPPTTPPLATTPPVVVPPTTPPVATTPPVVVPPTTPPVATTLPVDPKSAVVPPVATTPAVVPPVAIAPAIVPPVAIAPAVVPPVATTPAVVPPVAIAPAVVPPVAIAPALPKLTVTPPVTVKPPIAPPAPAQPPAIDLQPPVTEQPPVETIVPPKVERAFVGIIDTGFAPNNPDLDYSKVTLGRDRIDKDSNPLFTAGEGNEHGTFSWGLVSAIQGNDKGIDGYNDGANIYLSRAIGSGEWDLALTDFVSEAKGQKQKNAIALLPLDLTQKNADGTITTRYEFTNRERAALENARQNGVLLVVAAGNDGGVMSVLGQSSQEFENILTVGSSDGFGRSDYSSYGYGLDILVPGGTIDNPTLSTVGDDIGTMSGTSASAAKAAGMASKVWEANPDLNPKQIIDILTGSAIDLKEPGWDQETGFGVVNLNKAVQVAKETKPQSYTPSPFLSPTTWGLEGKVTPWERATYDIKTGSFTSIIWSTNGVNLRNSTNLSDRSDVNIGYKGQVFTFDAWTYGEIVPDLTTGKQDALWFRINQNGKSYWVPSAYTNGYPPGDPPLLPPANSNPVVTPPTTNPNPNPVVVPPPNSNPNPNPVVVPPPSSISLNGHTIGGNFYPVFQNYKGTLGNPTSDVINYNGVSYQTFDKGSIVSSKNGTFPLYGAIRQEFLKTGGLDGRLGAPTSAEKGQGDGTLIQYFEKGYISWNGVKAIAYQEGSKPPIVQIPSNIPNQSSSSNQPPLFSNPSSSNPLRGFRHPLGSGEQTPIVWTHWDGYGQKYAVDLGISSGARFGTQVYSMRAGTVVDWRDTTPDKSPNLLEIDDYNAGTTANFLVIKLDDNDGVDDGYRAMYLHLQQGSIPSKFKQKGARVEAGEPIGKIGYNGVSQGVHLHAEVNTINGSNMWSRQTVAFQWK